MTATFGMVGLGVMGQNLALNLEEHGETVAVWNLESDWTDRFIAANRGKRLVGCRALADLVASLPRPRRIVAMITAGPPVDSLMGQLGPLLEDGDVLIDGGNSWFEDTVRREAAWRGRGLHFVGMGVSGGSEGARRGPSLMPGGTRAAWEALRPTLEAIAAHTASGPCVTYVGPDGAGHFVKMVHNGIEYGDMQLIAEAYDILRRGLGWEAGRIAEVFARWNQGRLESFLVELTARVLTVRDPKSGRPLVDEVLDRAEQKGTGRWSAEVALELGVAIPTIGAALDARLLSQLKAERVAASRVLTPPASRLGDDPAAVVEDLGAALYAAKLCSYAQGLGLIAAGSRAHHWGIDLGEMARIWTGGCIIRARLLDGIMRAFRDTPSLGNLLLDPPLAAEMAAAAPAWRRTVGRAIGAGLPLPAFSASLGYYDAYRSSALPQNLTQAQRDAFGGHTYRRLDDPEGAPVHTDWLGNEG